jgi:hypothetical protein
VRVLEARPLEHWRSVKLHHAQEAAQVLALRGKMKEYTFIELDPMKKWLIGCGAATSGVYRVFNQKSPIAVVYYFRPSSGAQEKNVRIDMN